MSNKLIIKNDLIGSQTLPDNKLIFLISDDNDSRYHLSNFKGQISSLIYDIKDERKKSSSFNKEQISSFIYDIKKDERRKNRKFSVAQITNLKEQIKILNYQKENKFLTRILAHLSTLQRKLRYINELSFFNRWIEKFKTEQINDFHFDFKNKYINEKSYRKSETYIKGRADIEAKSFSFEELIKEMEKYKIPYHRYFIINELGNHLKINELKGYIDIFNSKYGILTYLTQNMVIKQFNLENNISKIGTLTISSRLSSLIKNFMEINKIESPFLSDYVQFLEWLFSDIDFSDNRDYDEKFTDYVHFVYDLMSNAKKI